MKHFTKFCLINICAAGLLSLAWLSGLLDEVWTADKTHLTKAIAGVFLVGLVMCGWKIVKQGVTAHEAGAVRWIAGSLVMLGLIGTVIGFIIALSGLDPEAAANVSAITPMVATMLDGMAVAMYTTLVGAVGNLWLMSCYRVLLARLADG